MDGAPRGRLRVTFLDVGQGDAAIVDLPDGRAMVIDGGGQVGASSDIGARVLAPALRARRRHAVAVAALSHPHPDHFLGLPGGLARVRVGEVWDTGQGAREGLGGAYAAFLARAPIVLPATTCGARTLGGARVEVLAPCPGPRDDRGANDNSLVIRIGLGSRSILFTGDAERDAERELLAAPERLAADVLKVGHHGSRTSSSPDLLAAVRPSVAVVSTGARNRFGHPHPATLAALAARGVRVLRTDVVGSVVVETDGAWLRVRSEAGVDGAVPPIYTRDRP